MRSPVVCLALLACSSKSPPAPPPPIEDAARVVAVDAIPPDAADRFVVTRDVEPNGTTQVIKVRARDAACPSLVYHPAPNSVSISRCDDQAFTDRLDLQLLRELADRLRDLVGPAFEKASISGLGDHLSYPAFADRLARYAQRVPWDRRTQSLNAYILAAAAAENMAPELSAIFQRRVKLTSLEKCWAGSAHSDDHAGEFLRAHGFTGKAQLPLGCSMATWQLSR